MIFPISSLWNKALLFVLFLLLIAGVEAWSQEKMDGKRCQDALKKMLLKGFPIPPSLEVVPGQQIERINQAIQDDVSLKPKLSFGRTLGRMKKVRRLEMTKVMPLKAQRDGESGDEGKVESEGERERELSVKYELTLVGPERMELGMETKISRNHRPQEIQHHTFQVDDDCHLIWEHSDLIQFTEVKQEEPSFISVGKYSWNSKGDFDFHPLLVEKMLLRNFPSFRQLQDKFNEIEQQFISFDLPLVHHHLQEESDQSQFFDPILGREARCKSYRDSHIVPGLGNFDSLVMVSKESPYEWEYFFNSDFSTEVIDERLWQQTHLAPFALAETLGDEVLDIRELIKVKGFAEKDLEQDNLQYTVKSTNKPLYFQNYSAYFDLKLANKKEENGSSHYIYKVHHQDENIASGSGEWAPVDPRDEKENAEETNPNEFLQDRPDLELDHPLVQELKRKIRESLGGIKSFEGISRGQVVQKILSIVGEVLSFDKSKSQKTVISNYAPNEILKTSEIIRRKRGVCYDYAQLFVALSRALGIPARIIYGIYLQQDAFEPHAWVEVELQEGQWTPLEPQVDELVSLPSKAYFPYAVQDEKDMLEEKAGLQFDARQRLHFEN